MNDELIRPNLHVVLVHFPMALLVMGVLIEVLSLIWRQGGFRSAGRWMILLGAIMAVPTCLSGLYAVQDVAAERNADAANAGWMTVMDGNPSTVPPTAPTFSGPMWHNLEDHLVKMAVGTGIVMLVVVSWLGCSDRWRRRLYPIYLLVMIGTVGLFMLGAWHGGEAVYGQGVGVAAAGDHDAAQMVGTTPATVNADIKPELQDKAESIKKEVQSTVGDVTLPRPNIPDVSATSAKTEPIKTEPAKPVDVKPEVIKPVEPVTPPVTPKVDLPKPAATTPATQPAPATVPSPEPKLPLPELPKPDATPVPHPIPIPPTSQPSAPAAMGPMNLDGWMSALTSRMVGLSMVEQLNADGDVATTAKASDDEEDTDEAGLTPPAGASLQDKVEFYAPAEQLHLIFAGLTVSLALISLGLSIRVAVNASARHRAEIAQQELTGDAMDHEIDQDQEQAQDSGVIPGELAEPITVPAPVPASRFWLLVFLLALVTMGLGWYTLGYESSSFADNTFGGAMQSVWDMVRSRDLNHGSFLTRWMGHFICGSAIVVLPIILAILARVAPRKKILLAIFSVLLIAAIAAQIWMGILLVLDGSLGSVTHMRPVDIVSNE